MNYRSMEYETTDLWSTRYRPLGYGMAIYEVCMVAP
jgi:hypothetical protein